jgi:pimeloyl-ACP methyl ester carboxylesterase
MNAAPPLRLSRSAPDGAMARANQTLTLKDGRRLGFAQFGASGAPPVFYFHGWPGSRFEAGFFDVSGVQMIGVDRPGYGLSEPHKDRKLADWPNDIRALADHLGFDSFAVVGMSGGGPYAAACAHALQDRVTRAAIIAGLGPPDAPGMSDQRVGFLLSMGQRPWGSAAVLNVMRTLALSKLADKRIAFMRERLPPESKDRQVLSPTLLQMLLASFREGLKSSIKGPQSDARIYGEPWPFKLEEISVPVRIWHGTADLQVPVSIGRHYAAKIPKATGVFPEGEGHISIVVNYLEAVIADIRAL